MTRSRVIGLAAVVLVVLVFVGRHERSTWQAKENRGIASVRQAVGAELRQPKAYRASPTFACLHLPEPQVHLGLELCFAPTGAIVEAIDRATRA